MLGLKRYIVALPAIFVIIASHVDASEDFCALAVDKGLCDNMVKGATNRDEAITKAITETISELAKVSPSGSSACKKNYKDAEEKLMESMETLRSGKDEDNSLNLQLVAALTSLEDCIITLKDLNQDTSAEKTLQHGVEQAIRVCLTVNTQSKSSSTVASKTADSSTPSYTIIS